LGAETQDDGDDSMLAGRFTFVRTW
jgi:hypothetical protein